MADTQTTGFDENIAPLSGLSDYEIADDSTDVRGWTVSTSDGRDIGTVDDLLVNVDRMEARYIVVSLDSGAAQGTAGDGGPVLVPVGRAHVDDGARRVQLDSTGAGLTSLPRYTGTIDRDYPDTFGRAEGPSQRHTHAETETHTRAHAATNVGADANRHTGDDTRRLTRSAEELRIGKRQVAAGEVKVHKHVETEHVSKPVTRMKEEVRVERRPVADREGSHAEIREDEIRVPIMEEEVVVEKRPVVKEELVISKDRVQDTETVEADLRKERIDVEEVRGREGETTKRTGRREI